MGGDIFELAQVGPGVDTPSDLPQHLIVLLDLADIAMNPQHVYRRAERRHVSYIAFHTGASATADIDIVLVRNAGRPLPVCACVAATQLEVGEESCREPQRS